MAGDSGAKHPIERFGHFLRLVGNLLGILGEVGHDLTSLGNSVAALHRRIMERPRTQPNQNGNGRVFDVDYTVDGDDDSDDREEPLPVGEDEPGTTRSTRTSRSRDSKTPDGAPILTE